MTESERILLGAVREYTVDGIEPVRERRGGGDEELARGEEETATVSGSLTATLFGDITVCVVVGLANDVNDVGLVGGDTQLLGDIGPPPTPLSEKEADTRADERAAIEGED